MWCCCGSGSWSPSSLSSSSLCQCSPRSPALPPPLTGNQWARSHGGRGYGCMDFQWDCRPRRGGGAHGTKCTPLRLTSLLFVHSCRIDSNTRSAAAIRCLKCHLYYKICCNWALNQKKNEKPAENHTQKREISPRARSQPGVGSFSSRILVFFCGVSVHRDITVNCITPVRRISWLTAYYLTFYGEPGKGKGVSI